jgi:hypothetical protein
MSPVWREVLAAAAAPAAKSGSSGSQEMAVFTWKILENK